jgi:hypothetical protein
MGILDCDENWTDDSDFNSTFEFPAISFPEQPHVFVTTRCEKRRCGSATREFVTAHCPFLQQMPFNIHVRDVLSSCVFRSFTHSSKDGTVCSGCKKDVHWFLPFNRTGMWPEIRLGSKNANSTVRIRQVSQGTDGRTNFLLSPVNIRFELVKFLLFEEFDPLEVNGVFACVDLLLFIHQRFARVEIHFRRSIVKRNWEWIFDVCRKLDGYSITFDRCVFIDGGVELLTDFVINPGNEQRMRLRNCSFHLSFDINELYRLDLKHQDTACEPEILLFDRVLPRLRIDHHNQFKYLTFEDNDSNERCTSSHLIIRLWVSMKVLHQRRAAVKLE